MDDRHWLLRALAYLCSTLRDLAAESFAPEQEADSESQDNFPTDEEIVGISVMMMEDDP